MRLTGMHIYIDTFTCMIFIYINIYIFKFLFIFVCIPPRFICPISKYIVRADIMFARVVPLLSSPSDRDAYALYQRAEDLAGWGRVDEAVPLFRKAFKISPELACLLGH